MDFIEFVILLQMDVEEYTRVPLARKKKLRIQGASDNLERFTGLQFLYF